MLINLPQVGISYQQIIRIEKKTSQQAESTDTSKSHAIWTGSDSTDSPAYPFMMYASNMMSDIVHDTNDAWRTDTVLTIGSGNAAL